jgi:hypothetical protein
MKKISTAAVKQNRTFSEQKLTIGLDLGDRSSWYCVLDETGSVLLEQRLSTTPKAMREGFGGMPRSRIALETGMHSPWVRCFGCTYCEMHSKPLRRGCEYNRDFSPTDDSFCVANLPQLPRSPFLDNFRLADQPGFVAVAAPIRHSHSFNATRARVPNPRVQHAQYERSPSLTRVCLVHKMDRL